MTNITQKWLPVDLYIGGHEHACLHLMYTRFVTMALHDMGYLDFEEPFHQFRTHGFVLGEDGRKMSKSLGNIKNPSEFVEQYGADATRMGVLFLGSYTDNLILNEETVRGMRKFLERVWNIFQKAEIVKKEGGEQCCDQIPSELKRLTHRTTKKVGEDLQNLHFNTAISALMILSNEVQKLKSIPQPFAERYLKLFAPLAPHLTEEIWREQLGHQDSIHLSAWPSYDEKMLVDSELTIVIQVNGKVRGEMKCAADLGKEEVLQRAKAVESVKKYLEGVELKKEIYVLGKLVSLVI